VTLRLAHLSDIHFGGENRAAARAAIDAVGDFRPAVAVITGDLTLNGLPTEFAAARAWLDAIPCPIAVTPGNHDTPYWNLILRALVPFQRYRRHVGASEQTAFDAPGLSLRCQNSARGAQPRLDWSKGAINLARLADAVGEMGAQPDTLRVFACHHPLIEVTGAPVTGGVHRGPAAAAILCAGGVDLILTGHVHNPFAQALPLGDGLTYAVGAGTLSLRTRGSPAGLTLITAESDHLELEALGWTGTAFASYRRWTLPRRLSRAGFKELTGQLGTPQDAATSSI